MAVFRNRVQQPTRRSVRTQLVSPERKSEKLLQFVPSGVPGDLKSRGTHAKLKKLANNQNNSQEAPRTEIYSAAGPKILASSSRGGGAHRMQPRNYPPPPPR